MKICQQEAWHCIASYKTCGDSVISVHSLLQSLLMCGVLRGEVLWVLNAFQELVVFIKQGTESTNLGTCFVLENLPNAC